MADDVDGGDSRDVHSAPDLAGGPDALGDLGLADGASDLTVPDGSVEPPDCIEPDFELYAVPNLSMEPTLIEAPGPLPRHARYMLIWVADPTPACAPESIWFRGTTVEIDAGIPMREYPGVCDLSGPDDFQTISAFFCPVDLGDIEITMGFSHGLEQFPVRTKNFVVIE